MVYKASISRAHVRQFGAIAPWVQHVSAAGGQGHSIPEWILICDKNEEQDAAGPQICLLHAAKASKEGEKRRMKRSTV